MRYFNVFLTGRSFLSRSICASKPRGVFAMWSLWVWDLVLVPWKLLYLLVHQSSFFFHSLELFARIVSRRRFSRVNSLVALIPERLPDIRFRLILVTGPVVWNVISMTLNGRMQWTSRMNAQGYTDEYQQLKQKNNVNLSLCSDTRDIPILIRPWRTERRAKRTNEADRSNHVPRV